MRTNPFPLGRRIASTNQPKVERRIISCAVCSCIKYIETDPTMQPGHYSRIKRFGACRCRL